MNSLDEIDAEILKELLKDGRKRFTTIAEEHNTSKDIIWKHYNDMKKTGIIVGATIQYNYPLFGYQGLATILVNVESQCLDQVFEQLSKIPNIHIFRQYNSTHNIGIISSLRNLKDLDKIKETLTKQTTITASRTYLWMAVRNTPENLTFGYSQNKSQIMEEKIHEIYQKTVIGELDETDTRIVEELNKNGRAPFSRIGQTIGVSTDTIARRYARLVSKGFIKVSIQINPILLGYKAIVYFNIAFLSRSKTEIAIENLSKIPNASYVVKISGDYDLQLVVLVREIEEIFVINEEIMMTPNIGKIETDIRKVPPRWPGPRQYISTF